MALYLFLIHIMISISMFGFHPSNLAAPSNVVSPLDTHPVDPCLHALENSQQDLSLANTELAFSPSRGSRGRQQQRPLQVLDHI